MIRHILSLPAEDDLREFLLITNIVSFRRFRAAYSIFIKGFYSECLALSRGLFENALILTALKNKALTLSEAQPFIDVEVKSEDDVFEMERKLKRKLDTVSERVFKTFLYDATNLSQRSIKDMKSFIHGLSNAVHRSNFALWHAYSHVYNRKSLSIEPEYNKTFAIQTWNLFWFSAACLNRTVGWFPFSLNDATFSDWKKKYDMTCELLEDFVDTCTAPIFKGLREFYKKTFLYS